MEGRYDLLDDLKTLYDELKQDVSLLSRTKPTASGSQNTPATAATFPIIAPRDSSGPHLLTTGDQGAEGQGGVVAAVTPLLSDAPQDPPPHDPSANNLPPHDLPPNDTLPPVDEPWAVKRKREKLEEQQRKDKEKNQQDAILAALDASTHVKASTLPLITVAGGGGSLGGGVAVVAPVAIALSQTKTKTPDKATRSSSVKPGQGRVQQSQGLGGCFPSLLTSPLKLPLITSLISSKPEAPRGPLIGCEITFTILLTDDNREVLNLPDLEAIDLPLLLAKQVGGSLHSNSIPPQNPLTQIDSEPNHDSNLTLMYSM